MNLPIYQIDAFTRSELSAQQVSARGADLRCELQGERVVIAGRVVAYLAGEICNA